MSLTNGRPRYAGSVWWFDGVAQPSVWTRASWPGIITDTGGAAAAGSACVFWPLLLTSNWARRLLVS